MNKGDNYKAIMLWWDDLSPEEQACYRGSDSEMATYIRISHKGVRILTESDQMEPEDVTFYRDLSWIMGELEHAYALGYKDGKTDA